MVKELKHPPKTTDKSKCSLLPLLFNIVLNILGGAIGQGKETRRTKYGKERKLFADARMLYIKKSCARHQVTPSPCPPPFLSPLALSVILYVGKLNTNKKINM